MPSDQVVQQCSLHSSGNRDEPFGSTDGLRKAPSTVAKERVIQKRGVCGCHAASRRLGRTCKVTVCICIRAHCAGNSRHNATGRASSAFKHRRRRPAHGPPHVYYRLYALRRNGESYRIHPWRSVICVISVVQIHELIQPPRCSYAIPGAYEASVARALVHPRRHPSSPPCQF